MSRMNDAWMNDAYLTHSVLVQCEEREQERDREREKRERDRGKKEERERERDRAMWEANLSNYHLHSAPIK